jgi:hypothetical protein
MSGRPREPTYEEGSSEMMLEDDVFWTMSHDEATSSIELGWKPSTADMSAADFRRALEHLAKHIDAQRASGTLVDVRSFKFAMTPELDAWRREQIIPAYNAGGLKRFAYLLPPGAEYRPGGGGDAALFTTNYFDDEERARAWLRDG